MGERSKVHDFLDAYRAAFEAFDVSGIVGLFAYPCQITSDGDQIEVTTVPTPEAWLPQRLVAAYRAIGVRSAEPVEVRLTEPNTGLAQAGVNWRLIDEEGTTLYDFEATYTLADLGQGMRITAIAHNEVPRLRALVERRGQGGR